MYRFFRSHAFDVVHSNTVKMNHLGRWIALAARVPCIIASEDNLCLHRSWKTRAEERLLAKWGDGVVMISHAVEDSFVEVEKLPRGKVRTVYYGLPVHGWALHRRTPFELADKRLALNVPIGPTVVCAARLHFSKSLETLIRAARIVVNASPNAQFILAGDGEERERLEKLRDALNLQSHFHFIGAREDVYDIFQLADVVTLCSLWEGLGFSLMEAMAFGKPVVGSDVAGINEIIQHGRNGLLVPKESPEALAAALKSILVDSNLSTKMGQESRLVLEERFDVRKNVTQLLDFYASVLSSKKQK